MKLIIRKNLVFILILLNSTIAISQDFSGTWSGKLQNQLTELQLAFNIEKQDAAYKGTMDSPSENISGIPLSNAVIDDSKVTFEISRLKIKYEGVLNKDGALEGVFNQQGAKIPLVLSKKRGGDTPSKNNRPQEPIKPYTYISEDVTFINNIDDVTLSGTLSLPDNNGKFPAVILISGSGPQNRDQEIAGHKPFLVISDYLVKKGIAVLRYDDRGFGKSSGDFSSADSYDFAQDAIAAVNFLKNRNQIDSNKIGIIGHSEGGLIAPIASNISQSINFIVLMAAPSSSGDKILLDQIRLQKNFTGLSETELGTELKTSKKVFDIIKNTKNEKKMVENLKSYLKSSIIKSQIPNHMTIDEFVEIQSKAMTSKWMQFFLKHNPVDELKKIKVPVLAINGTKDVQMSFSHLNTIKDAITKSGNSNVSVKAFEGLNHLFQKCETGAISEYMKIEQTISPKVLETMSNWIKQVVYE
ncbi:alpha/beta hydrolase family protein [Winogradskyella flava]|uniref:alpha/beta hydrolase family protein n=1 Tax=Winogradskyella flava TaxID=1884876 RepID=UPI002491A3EA|nr:alpha/beta fold hydrolase [Winogradskyella flava]